MPPEDLRREVAGARLGGHPRRLDHALCKVLVTGVLLWECPLTQYDDDLEALPQEVGSRHVVEWRVLVDLVDDHGGPDEEDLVFFSVAADLQESSQCLVATKDNLLESRGLWRERIVSMMLTHTFNSVWKNGRLSPSLVTLCLISCALT